MTKPTDDNEQENSHYKSMPIKQFKKRIKETLATPHPTEPKRCKKCDQLINGHPLCVCDYVEPNQLDKDIGVIMDKCVTWRTFNDIKDSEILDMRFRLTEEAKQSIKSLIAKAQTEARIDTIAFIANDMGWEDTAWGYCERLKLCNANEFEKLRHKELNKGVEG